MPTLRGSVQCYAHGAKVGTVQGQEAPVAIFSMATSSSEDLARTIESLHNLHRVNVAILTARGLAILVCSPDLLELRAALRDRWSLRTPCAASLNLLAGHGVVPLRFDGDDVEAGASATRNRTISLGVLPERDTGLG